MRAGRSAFTEAVFSERQEGTAGESSAYMLKAATCGSAGSPLFVANVGECTCMTYYTSEDSPMRHKLVGSQASLLSLLIEIVSLLKAVTKHLG